MPLFLTLFNYQYNEPSNNNHKDTFLGVAVTFPSIVIVVKEYEVRNDFWCIMFVLIALLFNPLIPVYLHKKLIWEPIDGVCGVLFLVKAIALLRASKQR